MGKQANVVMVLYRLAEQERDEALADAAAFKAERDQALVELAAARSVGARLERDLASEKRHHALARKLLTISIDLAKARRAAEKSKHAAWDDALRVGFPEFFEEPA